MKLESESTELMPEKIVLTWKGSPIIGHTR